MADGGESVRAAVSDLRPAMSVELEIPGVPVPKGRPRTGHGRVYTPAATERAEEAIAWTARTTRARFTGDIHVTAEFHVSSRRADADNLAKTVFDGLEKGGLFRNDRQVREFTVRLVDCERGAEKTVVRVREL